MSTILPMIILDTILDRLALLFLTGAGGDLAAARDAAWQMLAGYHPETPDELRLSTEVISFSFHAMEALSQAATPEMSLPKIMRLRGSAVSLSRESHKSQRKLDQLQKARRAGHPIEAAQAEAAPARPQVDKALALIEATRQEIQVAATNGSQTWTQSYQQRQTAKRLAKKLIKSQARQSPSSTPQGRVSRDATLAG